MKKAKSSRLYLTVRCRPFPASARKAYRVMVDPYGWVRVWDQAGGYYTDVHDLSADTCQRIRLLAKKIGKTTDGR